MARRPRIGISSCFFHADPQRAIFKGKTLQYVEQSLVHWVMTGGALAYAVPSPDGGPDHGLTLDELIEDFDGVVFHGGADLAPQSYGEEPLREAWKGDWLRDRYEVALFEACQRQNKPVLGVCRGLQLINVAMGGTLYQDINTQVPDTLVHRDWEIYDQNFHEVALTPGSRLAAMYGDSARARVNSIHHQGVKDVAPGLVVEARSTHDGIVEALRAPEGGPYIAAVQWHPEFVREEDDHMDTRPLLDDFLRAARR